MPEIIRLQTADFVLSVWVADISNRENAYQKMLAKRVGTESDVFMPSYGLYFSPAIDLVELQAAGNEPPLLTDSANLQPCSQISLTAPLFFENTQYQFEWIFYHAVTSARLLHRSQTLNESFRFVPETQTPNGLVPARLTGTISTGNDIGWLRLPLVFETKEKHCVQNISFEVLPTKMALHQDLPAMYQTIDSVYPLWLFSLVEKTEQDSATSQKRGHFPLMWLANFKALKARFEKGLKVICAAPHSQLQPTVVNTKATKLKGRLPHKLVEQVNQDVANGQQDKHYRVEKKRLSVDTPENRFIKMAVTQCKKQLAEFEAKLRISNAAPEFQRLSDAFLDELHSWQKPLQEVLGQSFLKEVGLFNGLSKESLVLQQKTGYSTVYRVWQELKFYLDLFGNQASISMKSIAEIYEIWCFLSIKQMLEQNLGFELVENSASKLFQNDFFEYQLKDGFAGAFRFKRADGVTARLAHEPKFTKKGQLIRSYLVNQEPDIVLEVTFPKAANSNEEKQFVWLFDAKYRIKMDKNRFDDGSEDITSTDYVPDDAINQMHRYRDALIRLSASDYESSNNNTASKTAKKSRPVFGAFALYPGFFNQIQELNPYAEAIDEIGIGAFALLPSQKDDNYCGCHWLLNFLKTQIGIASSENTANGNTSKYPVLGMQEKFYVQDAARIPYYGMHQSLYPDLTMTVALGGKNGRDNDYFAAFEQGTAQFYHLPQSTFSPKFKQHIAQEIRYLALATTSDIQSNTKKIDKLWPVKSVSLLPRFAISKAQAGTQSDSNALYYLFELGKPLLLQESVTHVPHRPIKNTMKLTTLDRIQKAQIFSQIESVYEDALVDAV